VEGLFDGDGEAVRAAGHKGQPAAAAVT